LNNNLQRLLELIRKQHNFRNQLVQIDSHVRQNGNTYGQAPIESGNKDDIYNHQLDKTYLEYPGR
jgi:uncharacterized protein YaaQ